MLYSRRDKSANVATNLYIVAANLQNVAANLQTPSPGAGTGKRANLKNWCGASRFRVRVAVGGPMPSWRNEQRRGILSPRVRV
jgi:hypothetical protein